MLTRTIDTCVIRLRGGGKLEFKGVPPAHTIARVLRDRNARRDKVGIKGRMLRDLAIRHRAR